MFKILFFFVAIGALAVTALKRRQSRQNLDALERGLVCFHCDSRDVRQESGGLHCDACGEVTSAEWLNAPGVSEGELRELTDPSKSKR